MKRHLFKLAIFLFLGAVVNVTVAWGFVASTGLNGFAIPFLGPPSVQHIKMWADHAPDGFIIEPKMTGENLSESIGLSETIMVFTARDPHRSNILCLRRALTACRCSDGQRIHSKTP